MPQWYAIRNDLIGGYAVGNRDAPVSAYDHHADDIIADFMSEDDAKAIAALLNENGYRTARLSDTTARPEDVTGEETAN